jgi:hypothetical protein
MKHPQSGAAVQMNRLQGLITGHVELSQCFQVAQRIWQGGVLHHCMLSTASAARLPNDSGRAVSASQPDMLRSVNAVKLPNESGRAVSAEHPLMLRAVNAARLPNDSGRAVSALHHCMSRSVNAVRLPNDSGRVVSAVQYDMLSSVSADRLLIESGSSVSDLWMMRMGCAQLNHLTVVIRMSQTSSSINTETLHV